jgi:predicted DNA-binding transcriptional regulator AlpA
MTSSLFKAPFGGYRKKFDTSSVTQRETRALAGRVVIFPPVSTTTATHNTVTVVADDDMILDVEDIAARYGIGRTKAYELLRDPGFPRSVVPGMTRIPLAALRAYEKAHSLAGTVATMSHAQAPAPMVVLSPPPARQAGRPRKAAA